MCAHGREWAHMLGVQMKMLNVLFHHTPPYSLKTG